MSIKIGISVTNKAWEKIGKVLLNKKNMFGFEFSAKGGGCNGYNYSLLPITNNKFKESYSHLKLKPTIIENYDSTVKIVVDPLSEMLLLGTNIDFQCEDYENNRFESKFIFTPDKEKAFSCGCGVSFSPR